METDNVAETLVSCFPDAKASTEMINAVDWVREHCREANDIHDLASLIILSSIQNVFLGKNSREANLLAIYRWAAANKVSNPRL